MKKVRHREVSNLPMVKQLVSDTAGIQTQADKLQNLWIYHLQYSTKCTEEVFHK